MNRFIYGFGRLFIAFIQFLPLSLIARLGRIGGGVAFYLDRRHRRVALQNLTMCFGGEKSAEEIHRIARENFKRIGENYLCSIKTSGMSFDQLKPHLEFCGFEKFPPRTDSQSSPNILMAIGHFGNFELYARIQEVVPTYQGATTYRGLKQPAMNRLMQSLRGQNGCLFFERRSEGKKLKELLNGGGVLLGLLADQNSDGLRAPFLGHHCNTGLAPAVLALRYDCSLYSVICHRVSLAKWRLEVGQEIATRKDGRARSSEDIMGDVNSALETTVRNDPANWFWVHRRWKN
jgi:Kdo2-lipid IVA lauroyltransferase/acyltransferase